MISFQTFFIWALLLIVHTLNSSTLRNKLLRLQSSSQNRTLYFKGFQTFFVWALLRGSLNKFPDFF